MELFTTLFSGPYAPWLPLVVYLVLLGTAAWDARTGIVPNIPLAVAALVFLMGSFIADGWQETAIRGAWGVGAAVAIWAINEIWFRLFGRDAIGMGDAKWTALAIMPFGWFPALAAWFVGSWISVLWIGACYALRIKIRKVYFAPFLFCGLTVGLLIARKIIMLPYPFVF